MVTGPQWQRGDDIFTSWWDLFFTVPSLESGSSAQKPGKCPPCSLDHACCPVGGLHLLACASLTNDINVCGAGSQGQLPRANKGKTGQITPAPSTSITWQHRLCPEEGKEAADVQCTRTPVCLWSNSTHSPGYKARACRGRITKHQG